MVSLRRIALLSICVFALKSFAAPVDEKLEWKAYSVHPSTFAQNVTGTVEDFGKLQGVKPTGRPGAFDVSGWIDSSGVSQPPGSSAVYFPLTHGLLILNSPENIELLDMLLNVCDHGIGSPIRAELTMAVFELKESASTLGQLNYADLRKIAGDSWTETATLAGLCSSGQKMELKRISHHKTEPDSTPPPGQMPEHGLGEIATLEIIVGPDGDQIDADVSFRAREKLGGSEVLDLSYNGQATVLSGKPTVLNVFTAGAGKLGYALVLRMTYPRFVKPPAEKNPDPPE